MVSWYLVIDRVCGAKLSPNAKVDSLKLRDKYRRSYTPAYNYPYKRIHEYPTFTNTSKTEQIYLETDEATTRELLVIYEYIVHCLKN